MSFDRSGSISIAIVLIKIKCLHYFVSQEKFIVLSLCPPNTSVRFSSKSNHWLSDWFSGDYGLQLVLGCSRHPPFNDCTGCRSGKTLTLGVNLQATAIWEEWLCCTFKPLTHIFCREETKLGVIRFHSEPDWSKLDSNRVSMHWWIGFTFCLNGFIWDILHFWRRAGILGSILKMQLFLLTIILCFPKGLIALWAAESIQNPFLLEEVELQMQLLLNSSQLIKKKKKNPLMILQKRRTMGMLQDAIWVFFLICFLCSTIYPSFHLSS